MTENPWNVDPVTATERERIADMLEGMIGAASDRDRPGLVHAYWAITGDHRDFGIKPDVLVYGR